MSNTTMKKQLESDLDRVASTLSEFADDELITITVNQTGAFFGEIDIQVQPNADIFDSIRKSLEIPSSSSLAITMVTYAGTEVFKDTTWEDEDIEDGATVTAYIEERFSWRAALGGEGEAVLGKDVKLIDGGNGVASTQTSQWIGAAAVACPMPVASGTYEFTILVEYTKTGNSLEWGVGVAPEQTIRGPKFINFDSAESVERVCGLVKSGHGCGWGSYGCSHQAIHPPRVEEEGPLQAGPPVLPSGIRVGVRFDSDEGKVFIAVDGSEFKEIENPNLPSETCYPAIGTICNSTFTFVSGSSS